MLATKEIKPVSLVMIWLGNFVGCLIFAIVARTAGLGSTLVEPAVAIISTRISNLWYQNLCLGILCGVLMYIAVNAFKTAPYATMMCVASFILLGANHCVADMAYLCFGVSKNTLFPMLFSLLCTTCGNVIGCNLIPLTTKKKAL